MNEENLYTLASLAVAALPDSRIVGLRPPQYETEDLRVTGVIDDQGNQFVVVAPRTSAAGASLEAQNALLTCLADLHDKNQLIIEVPRPIVMGRTRRNGDVMIHQKMSGISMTEADLANPALGASVGRAIASLHQVHPHNLDNAGMPVYRTQQIRNKHRATLDAIQETRLLPARLFQRWNEILDNDKLWNFQPCTVHGDLEPSSFLIVGNVTMGMRDFSRAHVGDPAQDFAWALASAEDEFIDRMLDSYLLAYPEHEESLEQRAQFITEINIAIWLLSARANNDTESVSEASQMLQDLADQLDDSLDFTSFVPVAGEEAEADQNEDEASSDNSDHNEQGHFSIVHDASETAGVENATDNKPEKQNENSSESEQHTIVDPLTEIPKLNVENIPDRDPDSIETYVLPLPQDEAQE